MTTTLAAGAEAPSDYTSSVTLIVTGADLDPSYVTRMIGLSPSQAWKKGDKKTFKNGKEFFYPWGGWKLFQPDDRRASSLEVQLDYWVAVLTGKSTELRQMCALEYSITLDCFIRSEGSATVQLNSDLIARLSPLGVGVTLNIFHGD